MEETRIIPWSLPTIPGQATNENPGGSDTGNVEYLKLEAAKVNCLFGAGGRNWKQAHFDISGVVVNFLPSTYGIIYKADVTNIHDSMQTAPDLNWSVPINPENPNTYIEKYAIETTDTPHGDFKLTIQVINAAGDVVQEKEYSKVV